MEKIDNIDFPFVSIIIPVYNGSNYLEEAINSALNQTYSNIEVLVINDGSNDNGATSLIAKKYEKRIRYFEKSNGGVSTALNYGIEEMKGDYFSWLSHDDIYLPFKIEEQINYIKKKNFFGLLFSNYKFIDSSGNLMSNKNDFMKYQNLDFLLRLFLSYPINGITTLIPQKIIKEIGLFNPSLKYCQDYDYWVRITKNFEISSYDKVVSYSRLHDEQGTNNIKKMRLESDFFYHKNLKELISENRIPKEFFKKIINFLLNQYCFKSSYWFIKTEKVFSINLFLLFLKQLVKYVIKIIFELIKRDNK